MSQQLSLRAAIFININIMLGTGVFINIAELAKRAGVLGATSYIIIGFLLLPLIWSMAHLLQIFPGGNFYTFGSKAISPFVGFFSSWSYFTSKLATSTLAIHVAVLLLQQLMPGLFHGNPIIYDIGILSLFICLNMLHLKTGSTIQSFFLVMKSIPLIFVIVTGLYLWGGASLPSTSFIWQGIPSTLPLVLYAALGFEAACSLSNHIKNPQKNAPLALFISYAIVITIATLYQLLFYTSLGNQLEQMSNFREGLPHLIGQWSLSPTVAQGLVTFLNLCIASSALGGSYGILFSNSWNLHALAEHNHLFFSDFFKKKNQFTIPWICVLTEGVICLMYLAVTRASQVPLQQIAALGCTITYTVSVISLLFIEQGSLRTIGYLGLLNCMILLSACLYGFWIQGFQALLFFGLIMLCGMGMYLATYKSKSAMQ